MSACSMTTELDGATASPADPSGNSAAGPVEPERRIKCGRCTMTFIVMTPKQGRNFNDERFPASRCSEPGCGRRFRHGDEYYGRRGHGGVRCWVDPSDLPDANPHTGKWP